MSRLVILFFLVLAGVAAGQERYLKPVDEAKSDPTFLAFREKLIAAAERKDLKFVMSILDPKVELSFGGDSGIRGFRELWTGKNEAGFWKEFLPVIKNGGKYHAGSKQETAKFTAPYVFELFPEDLDQFEHAAIIGMDVNLREKPNRNASVVGKLSYNIVKIDPDELDTPDEGLTPAEQAYTGKQRELFFWVRVTTFGGQTGYVKDAYVRRPVDYRAGFEKKRGRWVMTFFIAGD
jgi:hypothetical protein